MYIYLLLCFLEVEENVNKESGSEYISSEYDQNSLDSNDDEILQTQKSTLSTTVSSKYSLDATKINNGTDVCDDENMRVEISDRKIIKQNYYLFCSKRQTQLA